MAALIGKNGYVKIGTTNITLIDSFTITPSIGMADITSYGDGAEKGIGTIKDWNASFAGTLDLSDTNQDTLLDRFCGTTAATTIAFRFYTSSVAFWSGIGLLTGASVNSNIKDKVGVTFNMAGNGALTFTTGT